MGNGYDMQNISSALCNVAGDIRENIVIGGENSLPDRLESVGKTIDSISEYEQYFLNLIENMKQEEEIIDELMYSDQSSDSPVKVKRR